MIGDWVKMRTDLYRDPKVCLMADAMTKSNSPLNRYVSQINACDMSVTRNVMRNAVVGCLVTVWGVLRHQGKRDDDSLVVTGCSLAVIDDIADMPGFGAAMASVGWVVESGKNIILPMFFAENNREPMADARSKNAERQKRYRDSKRAERNAERNVTDNVTNNAKSSARIEKEKENTLSLVEPGKEVLVPESMNTPSIRKKAAFWFQHLELMAPEKVPLENSPQMESFWQDAARMGPDKFVRSVDYTTARGWINLRDPDENKKGSGRNGHASESGSGSGEGSVARMQRRMANITARINGQT